MSEFENQIDKVENVDLNHEMKKCYLEYSMSVIVARALPDHVPRGSGRHR